MLVPWVTLLQVAWGVPSFGCMQCWLTSGLYDIRCVEFGGPCRAPAWLRMVSEGRASTLAMFSTQLPLRTPALERDDGCDMEAQMYAFGVHVLCGCDGLLRDWVAHWVAPWYACCTRVRAVRLVRLC